MREKENGLFRKSSLERVSSPEKLNEYIKVVNPGLIIILVAILLILVGSGFWFFSGKIPKYLELEGVSVTSREGTKKVYCYVPIPTAKRLSIGMGVQLSPDYAPKEQFGYINGKVENIADTVATQESLFEKFENPQIVRPIIMNADSNLIEVEITVGSWSSSKGEEIDLTDGSVCSVSVIESEQKPYELIFNA